MRTGPRYYLPRVLAVRREALGILRRRVFLSLINVLAMHCILATALTLVFFGAIYPYRCLMAASTVMRIHATTGTSVAEAEASSLCYYTPDFGP